MQTDWFELWRDGRWFEATFGPVQELLGEEGVILLLGVPMTLALWIQTESLYVPATILVLFTGLIISGAPPAAAFVGYMIVVAATLLAYRSIYSSGRPM
jgi:hypothetical protein